MFFAIAKKLILDTPDRKFIIPLAFELAHVWEVNYFQSTNSKKRKSFGIGYQTFMNNNKITQIIFSFNPTKQMSTSPKLKLWNYCARKFQFSIAFLLEYFYKYNFTKISLSQYKIGIMKNQCKEAIMPICIYVTMPTFGYSRAYL